VVSVGQELFVAPTEPVPLIVQVCPEAAQKLSVMGRKIPTRGGRLSSRIRGYHCLSDDLLADRPIVDEEMKWERWKSESIGPMPSVSSGATILSNGESSHSPDCCADECFVTELLPDRIFTVEEANGLVGEMESLIAEVERLGGHLDRHRRELQILDALWGPKVLETENPDHGEFEKCRTEVDGTVKRIEELIRDEILARGIRFPAGGLEYGLLDFPTTLDGRLVYLCWKRGEPQVGHWHEIDGGFAGRRPLTTEHATRMGTDRR